MLALTRWGGALPERHLPDPGRGPAAFIVILQETEWVRDAAGIQRDVGIAAQTLLLAAAEKGLGGLMIGAFDPAGVKELLKLPDHLVPQLLIALGKPDETIVITEVKDGVTRYWRDEHDTHYVPKRRLEDIIY
jgi:nitroreductase